MGKMGIWGVFKKNLRVQNGVFGIGLGFGLFGKV